MTPTLTSLLSRVRAASGPDRELDADICAHLYGGARVSFDYNIQVREDPKGMLVETDAELGSPPHITTSIDAAVALVERVLPGANTVGVEKNPKGATAYVARNYVHSGHWMTEVDAATPPLAILAALLSALEQKESTG